MTAKFRKRPVEVEAVRAADVHTSAASAWADLPGWLRDAYERGDVLFLNDPPRAEIATLEGTMTAQPGDWIIRGVHGELYPCKPDIFEATYEPVDGGDG